MIYSMNELNFLSRGKGKWYKVSCLVQYQFRMLWYDVINHKIYIFLIKRSTTLWNLC